MNSFSMRFSMVAALAVLSLMLAVPLNAAEKMKGGIEAKIALETNLENRVKKVLTEITGTDQLIVIVNVQLVSEQIEEKKTKQAEDNFILPGVPIKEAISEKQVADSISAALGDDTRTLVKKMVATIIIDKGVSSSVEKVVRDVAGGILAIDPQRGDQLIIQKMSFQRNPFYWGMLFYPPNIYWVFFVITAVILSLGLMLFMFGPLKIFAKDFVSGVMATAAALKESGKGEGEESFFKGGAGPEMPIMTGSETRESQKSSFVGREAPFSFISEGNLKALIFLIKGETADTIASVVNYLPPDMAVQVLRELPAEKQNQIGLFLSKVKELEPSEIDRLEAKIKSRIGFLSGGQEKITQLLDYTDESFKERFIASLKTSDAQLAAQIQKSMINLDTIADLDVSVLQTIIKTLTPTVFAQILRSFQAPAQEKLLAALPSGAAARLKQEIDMAKPFTEQRLATEKRRLVNLIRRMEERGLLTKANG
ncbi:MAG: FliG C-terminal domain-containing protein [Elusimicrobiota bacterium]